MTNTERIAQLRQPTETAHYIVSYNEKKERWELLGKQGIRTFFMRSSQYSTPLIVLQNEGEARKAK